jgi:hypothetical protein
LRIELRRLNILKSDTTIKVSHESRDRWARLKKPRETYEAMINRIIEENRILRAKIRIE